MDTTHTTSFSSSHTSNNRSFSLSFFEPRSHKQSNTKLGGSRDGYPGGKWNLIVTGGRGLTRGDRDDDILEVDVTGADDNGVEGSVGRVMSLSSAIGTDRHP